jgi:hypothetical protein
MIFRSETEKTTRCPRRYLEKGIFAHIGDKPVKVLTAEDVHNLIWRNKASTLPQVKCAGCSSVC